MKTDLRSLYTYYDYLQAAPLDDKGQVIDDTMFHRSGELLTEIIASLPFYNARFRLDEVKAGRRLTPIEAGSRRLPVVDDNGLQICVGDVLVASVNTGRYGQMTPVKFTVSEEFSYLGLFSTGVMAANRMPITMCVRMHGHGMMRAGRAHQDVEHGFNESYRVVQLAESKPVEPEVVQEVIRPRMRA